MPDDFRRPCVILATGPHRRSTYLQGAKLASTAIPPSSSGLCRWRSDACHGVHTTDVPSHSFLVAHASLAPLRHPKGLVARHRRLLARPQQATSYDSGTWSASQLRLTIFAEDARGLSHGGVVAHHAVAEGQQTVAGGHGVVGRLPQALRAPVGRSEPDPIPGLIEPEACGVPIASLRVSGTSYLSTTAFASVPCAPTLYPPCARWADRTTGCGPPAMVRASLQRLELLSAGPCRYHTEMSSSVFADREGRRRHSVQLRA